MLNRASRLPPSLYYLIQSCERAGLFMTSKPEIKYFPLSILIDLSALPFISQRQTHEDQITCVLSDLCCCYPTTLAQLVRGAAGDLPPRIGSVITHLDSFAGVIGDHSRRQRRRFKYLPHSLPVCFISSELRLGDSYSIFFLHCFRGSGRLLTSQ
jgi:hypothetical protein